MMDSPEFNKIVSSVVEKSPFQRKKLESILAGMDDMFFQRAEDFAVNYGGYLHSQGIPFDYAVSAYLDMCKSMLACQIEFMKTGSYSTTDHRQAFDEVYSAPERMKSYMIALAISQFLWPTHYSIYADFERCLCRQADCVASYLEIGPGHGLYLHKAIEKLRQGTRLKAIDISPVSIEITRSIIKYFHPALHDVDFWTGDVLDYQASERYDFITMGEVLEHVSEPLRLLKKLETLLSDSGTLFVTTSINSPAIDHIYHFKSVEDVREMIRESGFLISHELVLPVENLPMDEIVERRITINYCAELKRGTSFEQV